MKVVTIVGARPQFIKIAPVSMAIAAYNKKATYQQHIHEIILHSGQHYDQGMSQVFFDELAIPRPHYDLGVGSGTHAQTTGKMLSGIEQVLIKEEPDMVLIYGDTNTTLAGALAASKLHVPVAHVEAGLRSFNRRMPEEINRVVADHLADLLFCPTETAVVNLQKEGISRGVFNVGDVMLDAFLMNKELAIKKSRIIQRMGLQPGNYCLATVHRQENTDDTDRLLNIFEALDNIAKMGHLVVMPLHPRTQKALEKCSGEKTFHSNLKIIPPVGYLDIVTLESQAKTVFTDSGGIQKEAFFSKVPCITLREETEWVETVEAGWNVLAGTKQTRIEKAFYEAINSVPDLYPAPYGRGKASGFIVEQLAETYNDEKVLLGI